MVPPDPRGHPVLLAAAGGEFGVADVQVLGESSRDGGSPLIGGPLVEPREPPFRR